jgi:hypothetical protein
MMKSKEIINGDSDWFVCLCKNEAHYDGFFTCLDDGSLTPPTLQGEWKGVYYVCMRCFRIIDQQTLEVAGVCSEQVAYANCNYDWNLY